jgi:putative transposase
MPKTKDAPLMHMIRKGQMHDDGFAKTAAEQFYSLAV